MMEPSIRRAIRHAKVAFPSSGDRPAPRYTGIAPNPRLRAPLGVLARGGVVHTLNKEESA